MASRSNRPSESGPCVRRVPGTTAKYPRGHRGVQGVVPGTVQSFFMIRAAQPADVPGIHRLIRALAEYERSLASATATEEDLRRALFGEHPAVFAHVAEDAGRVVGFALWFLNFSTWTGQHGIYLEDLFVDKEMRGRGYGKALLAELARLCTE